MMSAATLTACKMQAANSAPPTNLVHTPSAMPQMPSQAEPPLALTSLPASPMSCPTSAADELAQFNARSVTAEDSGKTLVIHQTDQFSVYLDDRVFPLKDLQAVAPGILGEISNGSVRGPNCFPIMFEGATEGKARLSDGEFQLQVVVDNHAPVSRFPLH